MADQNLAAAYILDNKLPWPNHIDDHEKTIVGVLLHDEECTRCYVERLAAKRQSEVITKTKKTTVPDATGFSGE